MMIIFSSARTPLLGALLCLASMISAGASAEQSDTAAGTQLILNLLLEEEGKEAPAVVSESNSAFARESEEIIDPASLTAEERAQLEAGMTVWVNTATSPTPAPEPVEWVEPLTVRESAEQVVGVDDLSAEQLAQFPEMKTAPLPVIEAQATLSQPATSQQSAAAEDAESAPQPVKKKQKPATPATMPRVTRWSGVPR